jgi:hypothetical protein
MKSGIARAAKIGQCQAPRADGLTTMLGGPYPSATALWPPRRGGPSVRSLLPAFPEKPRRQPLNPESNHQAASLLLQVHGYIALMMTLKRQRSTRTTPSRIESGTSALPVKVEAKRTYDPAAD